jgi:hypothetical protein
VAGKRGSGKKGKAARRQAQIERLSAGSGAGESRKARQRDDAARSAAAAPSAARWLVPTTDTAVAVDVVADLLALDPRTSLRGRGGDELRSLAGHVADLIELDVTAPSGRTVAELLTDDEDLRQRLRPALDLDALLAGEPVAGDRHDRTVRVAEALIARAAQHRAGDLDLYALVAPVAALRHGRADEVETTVRVAVDGLALPPAPEPAVVVTTGGWVAVGPVELFLAAGRGLLSGGARDVGGAALAAWLTAVQRTPDGWWGAVQARFPVEAAPLLEQAAARAGSDHPDVVGAAVVDLIALRYPVAPPA